MYFDIFMWLLPKLIDIIGGPINDSYQIDFMQLSNFSIEPRFKVCFMTV